MTLKLNFLSKHQNSSLNGVNYSKTDKPIKTIEEFLNWPSTFQGADKKWIPSKLLPRKKASKSSPQVIYCHDFKGGYLDDAMCFGNENANAIRFYHWQFIDIFQYFSHEIITIPPVSWIDVAHRNGVRVHGTFITEYWNEHSEKAFRTIFTSSTMAKLAAKKLYEIQKFYNFEGWLINLESKTNEKEAEEIVGNILLFLKELKHLGSEVIWYDAINTTGALGWQNKLSPLNYPFYKIVDGIFLNYTWKVENLLETREMCKSMEDSLRVFVGIDCFGRGCPGGGGYDTNKALEKIQLNNSNLPLSIALFAPGWVYEKHSIETFLEDNWFFWSKLFSYLPNNGTANAFDNFNKSNETSDDNDKQQHGGVYVDSTFCLGQGKTMWFDGQVDCVGAWNFLALQQIWPTALSCSRNVTENREFNYKALPYLEEGIAGGGCLHLTISPGFHLHEQMFHWNQVTFLKSKVNLSLMFIWKPLRGTLTIPNLSFNGFIHIHVGNDLLTTIEFTNHHQFMTDYHHNGWKRCDYLNKDFSLETIIDGDGERVDKSVTVILECKAKENDKQLDLLIGQFSIQLT